MGITIRARFAHGVLEPLEDARLHEGDEVVLRIEPISSAEGLDWLEETAGGWKGWVDAEELKKHIEESRLLVDPRQLAREHGATAAPLVATLPGPQL